MEDILYGIGYENVKFSMEDAHAKYYEAIYYGNKVEIKVVDEGDGVFSVWERLEGNEYWYLVGYLVD